MKIVVTGGAGKLGRQVIAELTGHGYRVLSLDRAPGAPQPSWVADLIRPGALFEACAGADGLVQLAAHAAPGHAADCATFNDNVAIVYNALKAASAMGVGRVVIASSIAAYGYIYAERMAPPRYLPLDEDHPCIPTDPYGLSKVVGETLADGFARRDGTTIVSLRFPGVVFDPSYAAIRERRGDPTIRLGGFWTYIDARDAAAACRLALEAKLTGHRVFNVAAPTSILDQPTEEMIRRYLPGVTDIRPGIRPGGPANWSALDSRKAETELGFRAAHGWQQQLTG